MSNLRAEADPRGGRVELSWVTPRAADFPDFRGVKVLRREGSYPDAQSVAAETGVYDDDQTGAGLPASFSDSGLKSETVYYYAVAAYDGAHPANYFVSYVSALATAAYGTGERMYEELPSQYQRFDTVLPPAAPLLDAGDALKGQLRRFVEIFGLQFDLLRSYASVMRDFSDVERIDGGLLPLLAQWLGWQTDYSLPLSKQRNEVRYSPHFYRTTGIAANLKATLNRLTTWDAQLKEFAHNVLRANDPERLTLRETTRRDGVWGTPRETSADWSFEGRPSVVRESEGQQWLFYHARHKGRAGVAGAASGTRDSSHVWFKLCNFGEWLPAQQLTDGLSTNRAPSAVRRETDGSFLVFYHTLEDTDLGTYSPRLRLSALAAGRPYQPARLKGTEPAPFLLVEGDEVTLTVDSGGAVAKTIVFLREDFADLSKATAAEVAAVLEREAAGVRAEAAEDGTVLLTSLAAAGEVSLGASGKAAAKLGLPASGKSRDATAAEMLGALVEPFALADGDTLVLKVDGGLPRAVTFNRRQFNDITQATAAEVAAVLKTYLPRSASAAGGSLRLASATTGATSSVVVDISASTAAPKLGLGIPPPPAPPALGDADPAAFEDADGGVWLFWSKRIGNSERIFYNRFDGKQWGEARALTQGHTADREPSVLYDPEGGRVWVFWSARRKGGRWNVSYATTANLDFGTHQDADWQGDELPFDQQAAYDNREPAARVVDATTAEVYFTSNRSDGQNVWAAQVEPGGPGAEAQVTRGQFTCRAPAVLGLEGGDVVRLWFRTNASRVFESALYPAARTTDARYSGSTTIDTRNPAKFGIRGSLNDVMHYTYDMGRGNDNWYSRDTVGIYLTPDTNDEALVIRKRNQIESLLRKFLPIQVRGVVIIQQVFPESVYTYDFPSAVPQVRIRETMIDAVLGEVYKWPQEDAHQDAVSFRWFRLSGKADTGDHMPDTKAQEPDLSARTYLKNVEEGDK